MDILLVAYKDMILSITQGYWEGRVSISKPIYMLAILDAIERNVLISNKIELNDVYIRNKFGEFYKQYNGNEKGYLAAFFIRPYYHLVWKEENRPPIKGHTPSAKYLQEHLLYAKLDDELWKLLQNAEYREFIRKSIITRFLYKK